MKLTTTFRIAALLLGAALPALFTGAAHADGPTWAETKLRTTEGKALFDEKCKTAAGEKVYKTVQNVEGVLLLKIRPEHRAGQEADLMWPGAAFAREAQTDEYITTFLGNEYPVKTLYDGTIPITRKSRGSILPSQKVGGLPGYRWVEVIDEKDGQRYRYVGRWEEPWQKDKSYLQGYIKFYLDKTPAPGASPRYGVTFEDHVVPEERRRGLASSTVKVVDLKTGEVLGEMLRYAWSPGAPSSANPRPWLTAYRCPDQEVSTGAATRKFVDQVLIPAKEK